MLVAGGGISPFTMDNLTPDGWKTSKVNFPIAMHMGCTLALNTFTFLFVYGWDFKYSVAASTKTAYFNMDTQTLIEGPERMVRRATSMRTMFRVSTTVTYAVVAGGFIVNAELYLDSTEYLDVEKQQWKSGPSLPFGMQDGTMVEHPMGGYCLLEAENQAYITLWFMEIPWTQFITCLLSMEAGSSCCKGLRL